MTRLRRVGFAVVAGTLALSAGAATASAATAPPVAATPAPQTTAADTSPGVITVEPATGTDLVPFSLVTSKPCPSGTNVYGQLTGPGLTGLGIVVVPNTTAALFARTTAGGLFMPSNNTLRALVDELADPPVLKGTYRLRVQCRGPAKITDLGDFYGSIVFDGHHGYVAHEPAVPQASLQTLAPAADGDPPVPSALASAAAAAPAGQPSPAPVKAKAPVKAAAARKSGALGRAGGWLAGAGLLVAAFGLATLARGRRHGNVAASR